MADLYYIEDDQTIALAVKAYLEPKGFQVTVCATLAQAKEDLKKHVPACILLDWKMPDGCGDGLCRWIRGSWPGQTYCASVRLIPKVMRERLLIALQK